MKITIRADQLLPGDLMQENKAVIKCHKSITSTLVHHYIPQLEGGVIVMREAVIALNASTQIRVDRPSCRL